MKSVTGQADISTKGVSMQSISEYTPVVDSEDDCLFMKLFIYATETSGCFLYKMYFYRILAVKEVMKSHCVVVSL